MSQRIRQLPLDVANKIAAGEIVERPANAVKELVENSLDAGARRITIELEEGGKRLIRVRDDGSGMSAEDAVLCLQRHATSKIQEGDDLWHIQTLGFRGEAMPSLVAVSRMEITTREENSESGTRIVIEAGEILGVEEIGCAPGTEIVVRGLFFNTPARFKFLSSDSSEAARVAEMIGHMALAYPHVAFVLRHNGSERLRVEAAGDAFNALVSVWGRETAREMVPIVAGDKFPGIQVTGFAGRPQFTRANRKNQLLFVNGRAVSSRALQHAFGAAYEGLIHGRDRYPVGVVFLQVEPESVDVNVHPTKSEVRFVQEDDAYRAVRSAIRETLAASQLTPSWELQAQANERDAQSGGGESDMANVPSAEQPEAPEVQGSMAARTSTPAASSSTAPRPPGPASAGRFEPVKGTLRDSTSTSGNPLSSRLTPPVTDAANDRFRQHLQDIRDGKVGSGNGQVANGSRGISPSGGNSKDMRVPPLDRSLIPEEDSGSLQLRALAQVTNNTYILCEGSDGLYIVNQHRAHERVLADRALERAAREAVESQRLLVPFSLECGPRALAAFDEQGTLLGELGFEVERFGGNALLVRAVPTLVANGDYERAFADLLDELVSGHGGRDLEERRRDLLTLLSCKNAIKAGDALNPEQMQALMDDLVQLPNPGICPHGQPILIKISTYELHKKFEREYAMR